MGDTFQGCGPASPGPISRSLGLFRTRPVNPSKLRHGMVQQGCILGDLGRFREALECHELPRRGARRETPSVLWGNLSKPSSATSGPWPSTLKIQWHKARRRLSLRNLAKRSGQVDLRKTTAGEGCQCDRYGCSRRCPPQPDAAVLGARPVPPAIPRNQRQEKRPTHWGKKPSLGALAVLSGSGRRTTC